jgi:hypothetical protein
MCASSTYDVSSVFALKRIRYITENCFSDEFINIARQGRIAGLMRFTPLGVGCPWYSNMQDFLAIDENNSNIFYPTLKSIIQNILQEESLLLDQLHHPTNDPYTDVYAAFQNVFQVKASNKHAEGRIRRAHVMTCLADRLMWASNHVNGTSISSPTQIPHHPFPDASDPLFEKYEVFVQDWPTVIRNYKNIHEKHRSNVPTILTSNDTSPLLSILLTLQFSSKNRVINTVIENFTRCALAIRALTYVRYSSLNTDTLFYSNTNTDN